MRRRVPTARRHTHMPTRRLPPGTLPETVLPDPSSPKTTLDLLRYSSDQIHEVTSPTVEHLKVTTPNTVTWLSVAGLGDVSLLQNIAAAIHLHPLALEDVVNLHQRPKVERYENCLFIVLRMPTKDQRTEQISMVVTPHVVVTFQERKNAALDPVRDRIRRGLGRLRQAGPDYLAYAIIDAVIDEYYPMIEEQADALETLETALLDRRRALPMLQLQHIRHELMVYNRILRPYRELVSDLLRDDLGLFQDATRPYLRDCLDHVLQLLESVGTYRELASHILDLQVATTAVRTNEIMRVLTVITTLFIPLTFIAGIYGMNFDPDTSTFNMPELRWRWGYPATLGVMFVTALALLAFFWRRGWLSSGDITSPE